MKCWTKTLSVLMTFALAAATFAQDVTLKVGDPAPPLKQGEYLKGEPVTEFEDGTVYVLEFWATWCGPCIAAIPHVTELQHEYDGDVVIIGQNVWEQDDAVAGPFVEGMGDKMDYRVALDDKSGDPQGAMANTWLLAAGQNGIPCSIIVDQQGMIAWIGHPMEMDGPLKQIVAGEFNPEAEAQRRVKLDEINQKVNQAIDEGDVDVILPLLDELETAAPELGAQISLYRITLLAQNGRDERATQVAAKLVEQLDDAQQLNELAWMMVEPDGVLSNRDLSVALKAAEKASKLTDDSDAAILDTLARVHHLMGNNSKAIEVQEKAIESAQQPALADELKNTLAQYKAAE